MSIKFEQIENGRSAVHNIYIALFIQCFPPTLKSFVLLESRPIIIYTRLSPIQNFSYTVLITYQHWLEPHEIIRMTSNEIIFRRKYGHFAIQNFDWSQSKEKKHIQLLEYAINFIIIRSGGSIIGVLWIYYVKSRILKR